MLLDWIVLLYCLWTNVYFTITAAVHNEIRLADTYVEHEKPYIPTFQHAAKDANDNVNIIQHDGRNIFLEMSHGKMSIVKIPYCKRNETNSMPSWLYVDGNQQVLVGFPFFTNIPRQTTLYTCEDFTIHLIWNSAEEKRETIHIELYLNSLSSPTTMFRLSKIVEVLSQGNYRITDSQLPTAYTDCNYLSRFGNTTRNKLNAYIRTVLTPKQVENILQQGIEQVKGFTICFNKNSFLSSGNEKSIDRHLEPVVKHRVRRNTNYFSLPSMFVHNPSINCAINSPPTAITATVTRTIKMDSFGYIYLKTDLFIDAEDGESKRLKLELKWSDGSSILTSDWLQYSVELQHIFTWATYNLYINQPKDGYHFLMKATDQCNASSTLNYFIKIENENERPPCYAFVLLVESRMDTKTPYIYVLTDVVNIMASSFNDSKLEDFLIQDLQGSISSNKSVYGILFNKKSIQCKPCEVNKIKNTLKALQNDKHFHQSFKTNLKYLGVTVKWDTCGGNSKPVSLCPIPDLKVSRYGVSMFKLPENTFYDAEDGYTSKLQLKVFNKQNPMSFVVFTEKMFIIIYQMKEYASEESISILQARDSSSQTAQISFVVNINENVTSPPAEFSLTFNTYYEHWMTDSQILVRVLMIISQYLNVPHKFEDYIILKYQRSGTFPQSLKLNFSRKTFFLNDGLQQFLKIKNKLFYNGLIASSFSSYDPRYMRGITGSYKDSFGRHPMLKSTVPTRNTQSTFGSTVRVVVTPSPSVPPFTVLPSIATPPGAPIARFTIGPFEATFCDFFVFPIPEDLFYDKVDGNTRRLKLSMKTVWNAPLSENSWIQLDKNLHLIYGYLTIQDYLQIQSNHVRYRLIATNSRGLSSHQLFDVNLPESAPHLYYTITMKVTPFYHEKVPVINEQLLLMTKISAYLGNPSQFSWMNIVSFTRNQDENFVSIAWSNCTLNTTTNCPLEEVDALASKMFLSNDVANSKFARFLSPHYILRAIEATTNIQCASSITVFPSSSIPIPPTPRVVKIIETMTIYTSAYFRFKIPSDTFADEHDGNTRYLSLSMVDLTGLSLLKSSWIQFNNLAQEIYANLYIDVLQGLYSKTFKFVLIASNSFKRTAYLVITVVATRDTIPRGGLHVDIRGSEFLSYSMNNLQVLTHIMQKYFLYTDPRSSTEVYSFKRSERSTEQQTFSSFSIRFVYNFIKTKDSTCNSSPLNTLWLKLKTPDGKIRTQLVVSFLTEVSITEVDIQAFGVCLYIPTTTTLTTLTTTATTTTANAPVVLNQIPVLAVKTHEIFRYQIPTNTFFQAPNSYTPSLNLDLLDATKMPVPRNSWIILTDQNQLIGLLPKDTYQSSKVIEFYIRANNERNLYVDMKISIRTIAVTPSNGFLITLTGNQLFKDTSSNLTILIYILEKYNSYIYSDLSRSSTLIVSFIRRQAPSKEFSITLADQTIVDAEVCQTTSYKQIMTNLYTSGKTVNPRLILQFYPTISITTISANSICDEPTTARPLSTTSPSNGLIVNKLIKPINLSFGRLLFEYIDAKTFIDGESDARRMELVLLKNDGSSLGSESWLQLNENILLLYGSLTLEDYKKNNIDDYVYHLKATNSWGVSVRTPVKFIPPKFQLTYSFKIHMVLNTFYSNNAAIANEMLLIVIKLNSYLKHFLRSGIQLIKFERYTDLKRINIEWTLDILNNQNCPYNTLRDINGKLFMDGVPSVGFNSTMKPEYKIYNLQLVKVKPCVGITIAPSPHTTTTLFISKQPTPSRTTLSPPIPGTIIPMLYPQLCAVFIYYLPKNVFVNSNSRTWSGIKLTFLEADKSQLRSDSWITFNSVNKFIYGMLTDEEMQNNKQLDYILRATNDLGVSAYMDITFRLPDFLKSSHHIAMVFKTTKNKLSTPDVIVLLIGKINVYLKTANSIRLLNIERMSSNYWSMRFASCNNNVGECDPTEIQKFKQKFFGSNDQYSVSFANFLHPELTVIQMTFSRGECPKPTITTTTPTFNVAPMVLKIIPELNVSSSKKFSYKLDEDIFFDVEDGLSRNLKLTLLSQDGKELSKNEWILFQPTFNVLTGILTVTEEIEQKKFTYKLVATDKGGLSTHQYITIIVNQPARYQEYLIDSYGIIYQQMNLNELQLLIHARLYNYITTKFPRHWSGVQLFSLTKYQKDTKENIGIKWSILGFDCENDLDKLTSLLFAVSESVNVDLAVLLEPVIILTKTNIRSSQHCSLPTTSKPTMSPTISTPTKSNNKPPIVYAPLPVLPVTKCTTFQYQIPSKTCFDSEDGFTPKLIVKLLRTNYTDVGPQSWIHLNQATQKLYGILKTDNIKESVNGVFTFFFVCEDREGLSVFQRVYIMLQSSPTIPPYQFVMRSYIYVNPTASDAEIQFIWLQKVKRYLGENIDDIQIKTFDKSTLHYPQIEITWYKCSMQDPCSDDAEELKKKLLNDRNHHSMNTDFSQSMVPEFVMISGAFEVFKSCAPSSSVLLTTPLITTFSTNKKPRVLLPVLNILLDNCQELQYQIPPNTFFDPEDGYTPKLKLIMKNIDGSIIPFQTTCVNFNSTTQTISAIYIMHEIKGNLNFLLIATDSQGSTASSRINIIVKELYERTTHVFVASARIYSIPNYYKVTVLSTFQKQLKKYYNDQSDSIVLFTRYYVRDGGIEIEWANCSLAKSCVISSIQDAKSKIFLYDHLVNSKFIADMAPAFVITSVDFSYFDNCNPTTTKEPQISTTSTKASISTTQASPTTVFPPRNTAPEINKQIPYITVPLCAPFSYRIPEDTFYDAEEGGTRNLRLEIREYNDKPIRMSSWIQFVEKTQVIYGHVRASELQTSGQFLRYLVNAYDQNNRTVTTVVTLVMPKKKKELYNINATFTNFFDFKTNSLVSQLFLVSKISSYVRDDDVTKVLVISFSKTPEIVEISWTNCTIERNCDKLKVDQNIGKFQLSNGSPSHSFQTSMQPYYTILDINANIKSSCSIAPTISPSTSFSTPPHSTITPVKNNPPFINRLIPPIEIRLCESFSYSIPKDVFVDEDGQTPQLSLELIDIFGRKVSRESWVQFETKTQLIYGLVKVLDVQKQPINGYRYFLKATDSQGLSASIIIAFEEVIDPKPSLFVTKMEIECSAGSDVPFVDDIFQINSRLKKYFKDPVHIKVVDFYEKLNDPGVIIYKWTNCTLDFTTCPTKAIEQLKMKSLNKMAIDKFLGANYRLLTVAFSYNPPCIAPVTTISPTPSGDPPVVRNYIPTIIVKRCSLLKFQIPWNTFYDPQDGSTRHLRLALTFLNGTNLPTDYWLTFDETTQTMEGISALVNVHDQFTVYLFMLTAKDSVQNSIFIILRIDVFPIEKNSKVFQNITLTLKENFPIINMNLDALRTYLLKRIAKFYGDTGTYFMQHRQFSIQNKMPVIQWTNCSLISIICNQSLAFWTRDKIMESSGICRAQFALIFLPEYTVNNLVITTDDSCRISPTVLPTRSSTPSSSRPSVPNTIKSLKNISITLSYCSQVAYKIPENLFYDKKDGNSRIFSYSLHYADNIPVTCKSWMQYNSTKNELFGNILQTNRVSPKAYRLRALNDVGSSTSTFINIDDSMLQMKNVSYKIGFSFKTTLTQDVCNADILNILREKLMKYFGDDSDGFISFLFFSRGTSNRPNYVMWTNCSINPNICDFRKINEISSRLYYKNGTVIPQLKQIMFPEFTELSVLDEKIGPCSKHKILSVGKKLDPICVNVCGKFTYKLPDTLFVNSHTNDSKDLIIELLDMEGIPMPRDSWIRLDEKKHELSGYPSSDAIRDAPKDGYKYLIEAFDFGGSAAQLIVILKFCGVIPIFKRSVTMAMECETIENSAELVTSTLQTITATSTLHNLEKLFLVNFHSFGKSLNISWTNCSEIMTFHNSDLSNSTDNTHCSIIQTDDLDHTDYPPVPSKEFLRFKVSFCGSNIFPLEEDFIIDKEDGSLSQLNTYLTFPNGSKVVDDEHWLVLLHNPLTLSVLPTNSTKTQLIYEFYLVAEDKIKQKESIKIFIEMFAVIPELNYVVSVRFVSSMSLPTIGKINGFLTKLNTFLHSNNTVTVLDFKSFPNGTVDFLYGNCSLLTTECSYEDIDIIENQLQTKSGKLNADLITALFPECFVDYIRTRKLDACLHLPNMAPQVLILQINITVDECGVGKYKIPDGVFYDSEDGSTRNLTLNLFYTKNCWMYFNETSQTLTTLYDKKAAVNQPKVGYILNLQATDAGKKAVNTTIKLKIVQPTNSSFQLDILFELKHNLSCFQEKLYILSRFMEYFNTTQQIGLVSLLKGPNKVIKVVFKNCSLRYQPCEYKVIDAMTAKIKDEKSGLQEDFLSFMQIDSFYIPKYVSQKKDQPCSDRSNVKPIIRRRLGGGNENRINISSCSNQSYIYLPTDLVVDAEDGNWTEMNAKLINGTNGFEVASSKSWIYLDQGKSALIINYIRTVAYLQPADGYNIQLLVTDSRQQSVTVPFKIDFEQTIKNKTFTFHTVVKTMTNKSSVETTSAWKQQTESELNETVEILSYQLSNSDIILDWTVCTNLSNKCDYLKLQKVLKYYDSKKTALNMTKHGHCLQTFSQPNVTNITVLLNACSKLSYEIPNTMFQDSKDGGTHNLTISVRQHYPPEQLASFIQYHNRSQTFTGILPLQYFEQYELIEYIITAINSDGIQVNATLRFVLDAANSIRHFEYEVTVILYKLLKDGQQFMPQFRSQLEYYLKDVNKGIAIYNWQKIPFRKLPSYKIVFTPCALVGKNCSKESVQNISSKLFFKDNKINAKFAQALINEMALEEIEMKNLTACGDLGVGELIGLVKTHICGSNEYIVHEKAFVSTHTSFSNMSVSLKEESMLPWVFFNSTSKSFQFKPTLQQLQSQPKGGYNLTLIATDTFGNTASQVFSVVIEGNSSDYNFVASLYLRKQSENTDESIPFIQSKLDAVFGNVGVDVKIIDSIRNNEVLNVTVYDCSLNKKFCQMYYNLLLMSAFLNEDGNVNSEALSAFRPEYEVMQVIGKKLQKCIDVPTDRPYIADEVPTLNMSLCNKLYYTVPIGLFMDEIDGVLTTSAGLCNQDGTLLTADSFIQYQPRKRIITGFLTQKQLQTYNSKNLIFYLKTMNSRQTTINVTIYVQLPEKIDNAFLVTTTSVTYRTYDTELEYLLDICNRIRKYFGDPEGTISIVEMTKTYRSQGQWVIFTWSNCTLEKCNSTQDDNISSIILRLEDVTTVDKMNPFYKKALGENSGFLAEKTYTQKLNKCLHTMNNVTVNVSTCGYFEYKLKNDMFIDQENGGTPNMTLSLKFVNFTDISNDFWIIFNDSSKTLYGMPTDEVTNGNETSYNFLIEAKYDSGSTSHSYLFVYLDQAKILNPITEGSEITSYIDCNKLTNPTLTTVIEFFNFIGDINDKRLKWFIRNNTNIIINWNHCNMTTPIIVTNTTNATIGNCGVINHQVNTMATTTTIKPVTDHQPQVVNSINELSITCGVPTTVQIPENTFYDFEDGTTSNLTLTLFDASNLLVNDSNFLVLNTQTNEMTAFISIDECTKTDADTFFKVVAEDKQGNTALSTFKTRKLPTTVSCCLNIIMEFNKNIRSVEETESIMKTLKNEVYTVGEAALAVMSLSNVNGTSLLSITNKTISNETCVTATTRPFTQPIIVPSTTDTMTTSFQTKMAKHNITNAKIQTNKACNTSGNVMPFILPPEASVGQFVSSTEWFIYLLPLFILAFMLLMCCLCYYCCRCCYQSCVGSGKSMVGRFDQLDAPIGYSTIPSDQISPAESILGGVEPKSRWDDPLNDDFVALPISMNPTSGNVPPGDSGTAPTSRMGEKPLVAELPVKKAISEVQQAENDVFNFDDEYAVPMRNRQSTVRKIQRRPSRYQQESSLTRNLTKSEPITTSFISRRNHQTSANNEPSTGPVRKRILRLPAIPKEPPPPYSPPRRHRIFRQNVIPDYYERYLRRTTQMSPALIPVSPEFIKVSKQRVITAPPKRRFVSLPMKKKKYKTRRDRVLTPIITIPESVNDISTISNISDDYSESSVEVKAILKGKQHALKRFLHNSPITLPTSSSANKKNRLHEKFVEIPTSLKQSNDLQTSSTTATTFRRCQGRRFKHKLAKPFLYDYVTVRRKGDSSKKYKVERKQSKQKHNTSTASNTRRRPPTLEELLDETLELDENIDEKSR